MTVRKQKWIGIRAEKKVKGSPLNPNAAVAARYDGKLRALIIRMTREVQDALSKLYSTEAASEYFAMDASVASQARILTNELAERFNGLFGDVAKEMAEEMTDEAAAASESSLKVSLKQMTNGLTLKTDILSGELKEIVTATVAENVALIKTIPAQYMAGVQGAVMRSITTGRGLADLVPYLQDHAGATLKRARLIANDQTRKAFNNINRGRLEKLGVKQFEWLHSAGGQHPRKEHIAMSGKVYSFSDLPVIDSKTGERGIPGQLVNCRCRMIPVLNFDEW